MNTKKKWCVLIADDDAEMRGFISSVLKREGLAVMEAADGREVLATLGLTGESAWGGIIPDLIITDHEMPSMTGLRAINSIRRHYPKLPIVLITAFGSPELHTQAGRLGVEAVLDKPFPISAIREIAERLLRSS